MEAGAMSFMVHCTENSFYPAKTPKNKIEMSELALRLLCFDFLVSVGGFLFVGGYFPGDFTLVLRQCRQHFCLNLLV